MPDEAVFCRTDEQAVPVATVEMYTDEAWQEHRCISARICNLCISGPAIIIEATGTNVIEPNWQAELTEQSFNPKALSRYPTQAKIQNLKSKIDPIQ